MSSTTIKLNDTAVNNANLGGRPSKDVLRVVPSTLMRTPSEDFSSFFGSFTKPCVMEMVSSSTGSQLVITSLKAILPSEKGVHYVEVKDDKPLSVTHPTIGMSYIYAKIKVNPNDTTISNYPLDEIILFVSATPLNDDSFFLLATIDNATTVITPNLGEKGANDKISPLDIEFISNYYQGEANITVSNKAELDVALDGLHKKKLAYDVTITMEAGEYLFAGARRTLSVSGDFVLTIQGQGASTIIKRNASGQVGYESIIFTSCDTIVIKDIKLMGMANGGTNDYGFSFSKVQNLLTFENIFFENIRVGLLFDSCTLVLMKGTMKGINGVGRIIHATNSAFTADIIDSQGEGKNTDANSSLYLIRCSFSVNTLTLSHNRDGVYIDAGTYFKVLTKYEAEYMYSYPLSSVSGAVAHINEVVLGSTNNKAIYVFLGANINIQGGQISAYIALVNNSTVVLNNTSVSAGIYVRASTYVFTSAQNDIPYGTLTLDSSRAYIEGAGLPPSTLTANNSSVILKGESSTTIGVYILLYAYGGSSVDIRGLIGDTVTQVKDADSTITN